MCYLIAHLVSRTPYVVGHPPIVYQLGFHLAPIKAREGLENCRLDEVFHHSTEPLFDSTLHVELHLYGNNGLVRARESSVRRRVALERALKECRRDVAQKWRHLGGDCARLEADAALEALANIFVDQLVCRVLVKPVGQCDASFDHAQCRGRDHALRRSNELAHAARDCAGDANRLIGAGGRRRGVCVLRLEPLLGACHQLCGTFEE